MGAMRGALAAELPRWEGFRRLERKVHRNLQMSRRNVDYVTELQRLKSMRCNKLQAVFDQGLHSQAWQLAHLLRANLGNDARQGFDKRFHKALLTESCTSEQQLQVLGDMKQDGHQPDPHAHRSVVHQLIREGDYDGARKYVTGTTPSSALSDANPRLRKVLELTDNEEFNVWDRRFWLHDRMVRKRDLKGAWDCFARVLANGKINHELCTLMLQYGCPDSASQGRMLDRMARWGQASDRLSNSKQQRLCAPDADSYIGFLGQLKLDGRTQLLDQMLNKLASDCDAKLEKIVSRTLRDRAVLPRHASLTLLKRLAVEATVRQGVISVEDARVNFLQAWGVYTAMKRQGHLVPSACILMTHSLCLDSRHHAMIQADLNELKCAPVPSILRAQAKQFWIEGQPNAAQKILGRIPSEVENVPSLDCGSSDVIENECTLWVYSMGDQEVLQAAREDRLGTLVEAGQLKAAEELLLHLEGHTDHESRQALYAKASDAVELLVRDMSPPLDCIACSVWDEQDCIEVYDPCGSIGRMQNWLEKKMNNAS